jgi:hypothetical protein
MTKLASLKRLWKAKGKIAKYAAVGGLTSGAVAHLHSDVVFAKERSVKGMKHGALLAGGAAALAAMVKPKTVGKIVFRRIKGRIIPILKK